MASKPGAEEFTQSWNKTVQWAQKNKIPFNAYYPVYQMDSQKLLSGSPMSESERVRAIEASAGLNYSTALPTDSPSPTNVPGNIGHNLANIFTGLDPISLVKNIFDTVTNTIEHPSSVYGIFLTKSAGFNSAELAQNMQKYVLSPHSLWSWVPGMADVAEAFQGKAGLKELADNPISSLLDVMPMGKALGKTAAEYAEGAGETSQIASTLGISNKELSHLDSSQIAFRLLKAKKLPWESHPNIVKDLDGNVTDIKPMTIGDRIKAFRNTANIGKEQGDVLMGMVTKSEDGTREVMRIAGPAVESLGKLAKDDYTSVMRTLATDHRSPEEIIASAPTPEIADALSKVYDYGAQRLQTKMQAGEMVSVQTDLTDADGNPQTVTEYYTTRPGSSGATVLHALSRSKTAQTALDKASKPLDAIIYKVQTMDHKMSGAFDILDKNVTALYDAIKKSIPVLSDDAALMRLRSTLPTGETWDRSIPQSTPLLHNLLGLPADAKLTLHHLNSIRDLFMPGGLLDQMVKAYNDQDWITLSKASKVAVRKFDNKVFANIPKDGAAILNKTKNLVKNLHSYAVQREKDVNAMDRLMTGTRHGEQLSSKTARKNSILALSKNATDAHQAFLATAIKHPPDVWRNVYLDLLTNQILNSEHSATLIDNATESLSHQGWEQSELTKLRQDPRTIIELAVRSSKSSLENNMLPFIDRGEAIKYSNNAYDELASLRARGYTPAYIPTLSPADVKEGVQPTYNVFVGSLRPRNVASTFSRAFDYTSSIYDVQLAILKDARDQVTHDATQAFIEEDFKPHLLDAADTQALIRNYMKTEIVENAARTIETGVRHESVDAIMEAQLQRMGLQTYDPSMFGATGLATLSGKYYVPKSLASAAQRAVDNFQLPAQSIVDRGTKVFRTSILSLSPRYTAHILFGGSYLVALRAHASMLPFLGEAIHIARTNTISDDTLTKFPQLASALGHSATQEGAEDIIYHKAAGYTGGHWILNEWMDNHKLASTTANYLKAAANVNFRFTRAIVRGQKALVYLDGAARAVKTGSFYDTDLVPSLDDHGNPMVNPATGKPVMHEQRSLHSMTPEQTHEMGMKAVSQVMGELRHMTPLERSVFTKIFPFYGWTKHILTYVMTYPIDHPYRAQFLSQLATQNSADVASGLPTRIQLLLFLGQPDAQGNVSAVDARFLDPLRDTANYASLSGLFQSLNPAITAPISLVDPQITFGANSLYPNVSYNALYGTKTAGAQGDIFTAAEQFVPQLSALDSAFNLSGQYSYLKSQGSTAFAKKVYESLNVPFFQVQHINLRQIAAQDEIDRYQQAENAAYEASTTGDFSALDQYPGTVPDPLNDLYNVTPAYLKALYAQTEQQTGENPTEALRPPANPAGL